MSPDPLAAAEARVTKAFPGSTVIAHIEEPSPEQSPPGAEPPRRRAKPKPHPEFDRYGRRLIVPDGSDGGPVPHTRVTSVAERLADRYGLERWKQRQVAIGLSQRPDLLALVASDTDDRYAVDKACQQAADAAGAGAAANTGTALHKFAENVDGGLLEVDDIPEGHRPAIAAYRARLDELGIEVITEYSEAIVVLPEGVLGESIAGRIDRVVSFAGRRYVLDIKTGRDLSYSWLSISIQLALYAGASTVYSHAERAHRPMPKLERDLGLVAHMPSGGDSCTLHWVDLAAGWEAAQLAVDVGRFRGRKDLAEAWDEHSPQHLSVDARRQALVERVDMLRDIEGGLAALAKQWPEGVATFKRAADQTAEELDLIAVAIAAAEDKVGAPFGAPDPATVTGRGR